MRFSSNEPETKMMENPLIIDYAAAKHDLDPGLWGREKERVKVVDATCADSPSFLLPLPFSLDLGALQHPELPASWTPTASSEIHAPQVKQGPASKGSGRG